MWLVGTTAPKHLDGSMPGDFGFDVLGLGTDPEKLKYYREAELTNGRWYCNSDVNSVGNGASLFGPWQPTSRFTLNGTTTTTGV